MLSDSHEAFFLDASFGRFVLFEQVEGDAIEDGEVLCICLLRFLRRRPRQAPGQLFSIPQFSIRQRYPEYHII